jgi:hypothetical protein
VKDLQKGTAGESIYVDSYAVSVPIKITDSELIGDIKKGKKSLSCGYSVKLEYASGNWLGVPYDAIQRDIRYNHIAVVDEGRAGDLVKMVLKNDSKAGVSIDYEIKENETQKEDGGKEMLKKFKIDGIEYEAENDFIKIYKESVRNVDELSGKLDEKNELISKIEAERDSLKDEKEELNKKLEENKITDEMIEKEVSNRIALLELAKDACVEIEDGAKNSDIKKSIIKSVFPNANLDGKDEVYVDARYESAVDILVERKKENEVKDNNERTKKPVQDNVPGTRNEVVSYEKKRKEYIDSLKNRYKTKK